MKTQKKKVKNKTIAPTAAAPTATATGVMKTHWPVHAIALMWPAKPVGERAEMKQDLVNRAKAGLDPLENAILLYDGQILDGRTRSELWMELAEENACEGYFKTHRPRTETFTPEKDGTIEAWMRAKSRNMIVRQTPADQRAAIFLQAIKQYPELEAIVGKIKEENLKNKKGGKALAAGGKRGSTVKQMADKVGVGTTTMKEAQQLEKEAPDKSADVAAGKTSAKKELQKIKEQKKQQAQGNSEKRSGKKNAERPKISELVGIVHRGLGLAEEADQLSLKSNAVFFVVNDYRIKVTCQIV